MKAKFIMIASSKGGVGKSTAALGISGALAQNGYKVLLADLDFGNACLDMLLGVQDSVLCTLQDVATGRASAEGALIKTEEPFTKKKKKKKANIGGGLWLLPSSVGGVGCIPEYGGESALNDESVCRALKECALSIDADYVIIDTGAGINSAFGAAAAVADSAFVVTGHMPVALRSAEATVSRLSVMGVGDIRLLINSFDAEGVIDEARRGLFTVIDESRASLIGVVPYDYSLMLYHEGLSSEGGCGETAFFNIAKRIEGCNVPLFKGIKRIRKVKKKLYL